MNIKTFPRAVYRNGEYAEAKDEIQLADLEANGFADWSIDSRRDVAWTSNAEYSEKQQSVVSLQQPEKRRGRPPKVQQ